MSGMVIRIFDSNDKAAADFAEGELAGSGYAVRRFEDVPIMKLIDDTQTPQSSAEYMNVIVLTGVLD